MRRNLIISRWASVVFMSLIVSGATACTSPWSTSAVDCTQLNVGEPSDIASSEVAVILAPTDSFVDMYAAVNSEGALLRNILLQDKSAKKLSIVLADGNPRVLATNWIDFTGADLDSQKNGVVEDALTGISDAVDCVSSGAIATSEQSDYLGSFQKAASTFSPDATTRNVLVFGNGIQTGGANYAMQRDSLPASQAGIDSILSALRNNTPPIISAKNLGGANVKWIGLGQVSGENQAALNTQTIDALVNFWASFVVADGGVVHAGDIKAGDIADATGTSTGVIKTDSIANLAGACIGAISLSDDDVKFKENLAVFESDAAAIKAAKKVKVQLDKKPCTTAITVTGYVASDTSKTEFEKNPNRGDGLSLQRAQAFAALLRKVGVSSSVEIKSVAGGCPGNDWDEQGNKLESKQKLNRKVVVSQ